VIRFVADQNFNGHVIRGVRERTAEADIVRVQDIGLAAAEDPAILE
jgi:hypothetical protein